MNAPRAILRCPGGKARLAPWITGFLPPHARYLEPWGGAASVLMQKPACGDETVNDLDERIVNVFRVLRDPAQSAELARRLRLTPYARAELAWSYGAPADAVDAAHKTLVRSMLGHGSDALARLRRAGFRSRVAGNAISPAKDWAEYADAIEAFTQRLAGVVIEQGDALQLLARLDGPDLLVYADPAELDEESRAVTLQALNAAQAMIVLSLDADAAELPGWECQERRYMDAGDRAREQLWLNPACAAALNLPRPGRALFG